MTYSFCGYPMTAEQVNRWPERIPIRDERDGTFVERARTVERVPVRRCWCGRPALPGELDCAEHDNLKESK